LTGAPPVLLIGRRFFLIGSPKVLLDRVTANRRA
jgi:hypothetical protein